MIPPAYRPAELLDAARALWHLAFAFSFGGMAQRPMPPCLRRIPGAAGPSLFFGGVSEVSRFEGLEREMRSRPFFSLRQAAVPRLYSYGHFPQSVCGRLHGGRGPSQWPYG